MFQRKKLRKEYDQKLMDLIDRLKKDWENQNELNKMSYGQNDELHYRTLLAKAKYFFQFREARIRKIKKK